VPHRVVAFVLRDAKHLTAGDVDHGRVAWVFLGGAAELGVAGVLFGAGQEAEAIGMLVPPRHECGLERPGLFRAEVTPALRVPGPGQLRGGRQLHRPVPVRYRLARGERGLALER
jgi:hypothetical protein